MYNWQSIIALMLVALSAGYLMLRAWQVLMTKKTPGCASGCGTCPANASDQKTLITIELKKR